MVIRARSEAAHKEKRADRATLETTIWEPTQFVLAVVTNTWFRKIWDSDSLYTKVAPKELFSHLQASCTGRHSLSLLALHNEMHRYHLEVKGIP